MKDLEVIRRLADTLAALQERLTELSAESTDKVASGLARGTKDLTRQAERAVQETTEAGVERCLRRESLTTLQIGKALGLPLDKVDQVIKQLHQEHRVWNVGSAEYPVWTWRIGDETPLPELVALVRRLISERPMSTKELSAATGARYTRTDGAIITLRRSEVPDKILNLGTARSARWFLVPESARSASLAKGPADA